MWPEPASETLRRTEPLAERKRNLLRDAKIARSRAQRALEDAARLERDADLMERAANECL